METVETWLRGNSPIQTAQEATGSDRKADADLASSPGPNRGESDPEKLAWESLGFTKPKNGLISKRIARDLVRARIMDDMAAMIAAQIAQAKGLKYMVARDDSGKFRRIGPEELAAGATGVEVWEKDPSTAAFTDLMTRAIDKPKEQEQEIIVHNSEELLARLDSWKVANRQAIEVEATAARTDAPSTEPTSQS
jgi:hypothetical protein